MQQLLAFKLNQVRTQTIGQGGLQLHAAETLAHLKSTLSETGSELVDQHFRLCGIALGLLLLLKSLQVLDGHFKDVGLFQLLGLGLGLLQLFEQHVLQLVQAVIDSGTTTLFHDRFGRLAMLRRTLVCRTLGNLDTTRIHTCRGHFGHVWKMRR